MMVVNDRFMNVNGDSGGCWKRPIHDATACNSNSILSFSQVFTHREEMLGVYKWVYNPIISNLDVRGDSMVLLSEWHFYSAARQHGSSFLMRCRAIWAASIRSGTMNTIQAFQMPVLKTEFKVATGLCQAKIKTV